MEWMYKANSKGVNSEDYLLGKKIDSAVLDSQQEEEQESASGLAAVDMANKIREDPLFAIKQKEASKRKALLENPIRLKQLQDMLQAQVGEKSKKYKKEKKSRKEKKRKKSHRRQRNSSEGSSSSSDGSEDSEGDLDAKLMERLRGKSLKEEEMKAVLKGSKGAYGLIGGKSSSKSDGDHKDRKEQEGGARSHDDDKLNREDKRDRRDDRGQKDRLDREDKEGRRDNRGQEDKRDRKDNRGQKDKQDRKDNRGQEDGMDRENKRDKGDSKDRQGREDRRDRVTDRRGHQSSERRQRSRSPRRERKRASEMDEDELDRKRREMMDNAKWRDDQRKTRIEQYKVEDAKVDEMEKTKPKKQDFFNPLKVTSQSSVEDRIKRNIHNIQRTKADLDKNFAKR